MSIEFVFEVDVASSASSSGIYTEMFEVVKLTDIPLKLGSYLSHAAANSSAPQAAAIRIYKVNELGEKSLIRVTLICIEPGASSSKGKTAYRDYFKPSARVIKGLK